MANSLDKKRPFDNFRVAITDPAYFFGQRKLVELVKRSPFEVRILLGGRRIGKTSILRAVEWNLLNFSIVTNSEPNDANQGWREKFFPTFSKLLKPPTSHKNQALLVKEVSRGFPVFINLQVEQPKDLDTFRYLLIARLREAINRRQQIPGSEMREMYRQFLSQVMGGEVTLSFLAAINVKFKVDNPDYDKKLNHEDFRKALLKTINELQEWQFEGVCFLLDGSEFIVSQDWANDAWSYLRGLKDTDTALKPFIGFLLSGYRNLKDYQQAVGSPLLNIAEIIWLTALNNQDIRELIGQRINFEEITLTEEQIQLVIAWAGGHPYLTQQMLNMIFDDFSNQKLRSIENLKIELLRQHYRDFSAWWNDPQRSYSFSEHERAVYHALMQNQNLQGSIESLARDTHLSYGEVGDSLDVLTGTGIVLKNNDELYTIGSQIFGEWVAQQKQL
ncbi:ATP-binding protein [Nodularia sp. LEGE 04288]|uniref:ATP-binding protein n=1 Tax=Nodularia sp. LEGE 04288 TaxID=1828639 RepID=UPI001D10D8DB|nr:ATP-binding protein [Nodularia sp. LEGE 04288]MCC2692809.1 ATP-binding protein [Nodularia sp. LEGE 04288]